MPAKAPSSPGAWSCLKEETAEPLGAGARLWRCSPPGCRLRPAARRSLRCPDMPTLRPAEAVEQSMIEQPVEELIVVAHKQARPVHEIAANVSTFDSASLRHELASSVADAFRYAPGIDFETAGSRFGAESINIRGISGNRVAVLLDGVPISDQFSVGSFSNATRDFVNAGFVDRLEVLHGPASALYGSAAIGGVVAMQTADPGVVAGRAGQGGRLVGSWRDDNASWHATAMHAFAGESVALLGGVSERAGRGARPRSGRRQPRSTAPGQPRRAAEAGRRRRTRQLLACRFLPSDERRLVRPEFHAGQRALPQQHGARGRRPLSHRYLQPRVPFRQRSRRQRSCACLRSGRKGQATHLRRTWSLPPAGRDRPLLRIRSGRTRRRVQPAETGRRFRRDAPLGFWRGVSAPRDRRTSRRRVGRHRRRRWSATCCSARSFRCAIFRSALRKTGALISKTRYRWAAGRSSQRCVPIVTNVSPRVDAIYAEDYPFAEVVSISDGEVSPKLGVVYRLFDTTEVYLQYTRGFRAPPYEDANIGLDIPVFNYRAIPNPDLRSERSDGFDLGLRWRGLNGKAHLSVFRTEFDDFIESRVRLGPDPVSGRILFPGAEHRQCRDRGRGGRCLARARCDC